MNELNLVACLCLIFHANEEKKKKVKEEAELWKEHGEKVD